MVHSPSSYAYDFWLQSSDLQVELSCLMPNGVFIPLEASRTATLHEIKEVGTYTNSTVRIAYILLSPRLVTDSLVSILLSILSD